MLSLLFASCGGELVIRECTQFTAGICFNTSKSISVDDVLNLVEITEQELLKWYPDTPPLSELFSDVGVKVYIRDEALAAHCEEIDDNIYVCDYWISGVAMDDGTKIYIRHQDCLAWTALAHELLHTFELQWLGAEIQDAFNHVTPHLFYQYLDVDLDATYEDIVEDQVRIRLTHEFTSEACNVIE